VLLEFVLQSGGFWTSIETKVDTGVEIVKCIHLLHSIIIDVEGLHGFSSTDCGSLDANGGTQFKKCRMHNSFTSSARQTRDLFYEFFHSPAGSVLYLGKRRLLQTCRKVTITLCNHMNSVLHICIYRIFSNLFRTLFAVSEGKKIGCGLESLAD
jgi:hypothetical protein